MTDYLPHDGSRPSLALRTDGLVDLRVVDAGDVEMPPGDIVAALGVLEEAVEKVARAGAIPVVLGGDHSIAFADATGVANVLGHGRVSMIHFDAHADTGDIEFGSLWGHGQPMRRLIESGALRGDRFLQVGLRGYWPPPETLDWMAAQRMRSFEMTEIVHRGLPECLTEAFTIATDECDGVFLSVDIDVCDPGHAPGTGTPEPGGLSARELLDSVRRICLELPVVGIDVVEVSPPYDHADITAALANRVVLEALSAIARKRRDERDGTRWDPSLPLLANRIPEGHLGGHHHGHTHLTHDEADLPPG
jgi:agmatinase